MKLWPVVKDDKWLEYYLGNKKAADNYFKLFEKAYNTLSKKISGIGNGLFRSGSIMD
jgi:hypothetical protein